ncbi:MAG TPA: metal ABC transporter substrate-binding protein [Anaerolineales bacterium]|nr:metal ABC transporter substrate-binding protein [Anaerolineales bacterium]
MKRLVQTWTLMFLLAVALASCSGGAVPDVLTTTTILADVARNVAGDRLTVGSLVPVGADPHSYQPVPQDATKISESRVLVIHGAEYENFLESLLENAGGKENVIDASTGLRLLSNEQGTNPHLWLDPISVIAYTDNIREGLTQFDPDGAEIYQVNASAYIDELTELDAWINGQIAQIPPQRRVLVTNHESLGYFADRYGFIVIGAIVPNFNSDASPSAEQMAALIEQIKLHEAPAIFLDASDNPDLAQQIATETSVKVITDLHLESLTEGPPAATYIDMMKDNVTKIVQALQ